jgi:beta-mannosidase
MYPHRINLRGPWQCEPLAPEQPNRIDGFAPGVLPRPVLITMPSRWEETVLADYRGTIRCLRRFHWQKPLDANERLFLVVSAADYRAEVTLNENFLGGHEGAFDPFEFEITALVQASNLLRMDVVGQTTQEPSHGLWGTVFLEVRRESFLRDVTLETLWTAGVPRLKVTGAVVGKPETKLDLDLVLQDQLLLSQPAQAAPEGTPFQLLADLPPVERWQSEGQGHPRLYEIRLELLDVHSRIYTQSFLWGFREVRYVPEQKQVLVNGRAVSAERCEEWLLQEPLLEARTLEQADLEGRLLRVRLPPGILGTEDSQWQLATIRRYLSQHPSIVDVCS